MNTHNISDELLNAFVDNELDSDEKSEIFDALGKDESIRDRICELRSMKEMLKHAYSQPPVRDSSPIKKLFSWWIPCVKNMPSLASCMLLLLIGWGSGWLMSPSLHSNSNPKLLHLFQAAQSNIFTENPDNIIVHVSNSNPIRLRSALDETENLLEANRRSNRNFKVEIIANAGGVDLLRSDVSPFAKRITLMKAKYPNLELIACSQTIAKLQENGIAVLLLPDTGVASSAVEQINKRLHQGWDYVRI